MAPYPTTEEIAEFISYLSTDNFQPFFDRIAKDSVWDVPGSTGASGHFTSLEQWKKGALGSADNVLTSPLRFKLVHITGGGDQPWAAVELEALHAVARNGLPYPQKYCWVMRFNEQGIVVKVRVYADTQLAQEIISTNVESAIASA